MIKSVSLPLHDGGKDRRFYSITKLSDFIEKERETWSFANSLSNPYTTIGRAVSQSVINPTLVLLKEVQTAWEQNDKKLLDNKVDELKKYISITKFPFSETLKGVYITEKANAQEEYASLLLLSNCIPTRREVEQLPSRFIQEFKKYFWGGNSAINNTIQSLTLEINKAAQDISNFEEKLNSSIIKAQSQTRDLTNEVFEEAKGIKQSLESWFDDIKGRAVIEKESFNNRVKKNYKEFLKARIKQKKQANFKLKEAEDICESAKDTYLSQIELDSAVSYWEDKREGHEKSKKGWLKVMFALGAAIIFSPLIIYSLPQLKIESSMLLFDKINPLTLVISVLTISVISYFMKVASKQYTAHQHLELEATERKTMLKTYLALMVEGKLSESEDRKVALDTLFRVAQTGIVNDTGGVLPTDSIIKIIERGSGKSS